MSLKNPYELVIRFDTTEINHPKEGRRSTTKRSKKGCFNCRKRKKKCDEALPSCSSCTSKCIPCVWPKDTKEKLPKEYKIPEIDRALVRRKQSIKTFIPVRFDHSGFSQGRQVVKKDASTPMVQPLVTDELTQLDDLMDESLLRLIGEVDGIDELLENNVKESSPEPLDSEAVSTFDVFSPRYVTSDNLVSMTSEDTYLVVCINGFIRSVGPQYTHPQLTSSATFTPFVSYGENPVMASIASACGCAFMSWSHPSLGNLAFEKYTAATKMLKDHVEKSVDGNTDTWLCAGFQLLCLCAKVTFLCTSRHSNDNLRVCYRIIKQKLQAMSVFQKERKGNERIQDAYFKDFTSDNLKMEIENSLIHFELGSSVDRQFERMFIESFIYNYSVGILVCSDVDGLPNPFEVFHDLRAVLKTPLFSCDVAWMNNPVFGAAFDSYELAAKASYLIRHMDDPNTFPTAKKLYSIACFSPLPMLPAELRVDPSKYQILRDSVLIGEVVLRSSKILLKKIINIDMSGSDPDIQKEVEVILRKLQQTTKSSQCKAICAWALFVCGTACIVDDQRRVITENCTEVGEILHGHFVFSVLRALDIAWGRTTDHYLSGRGTDVLLDGDFLSQITL